VKPQRVRCKLGETIEEPCSDVLAHTPEVCMGACLDKKYPAIQDSHDSWGMCTTSTECKTDEDITMSDTTTPSIEL
jgi:hypothetical protein